MRRSVRRQALISAASVTIAVPCWSSWKTGMSSASCRRCSISKQRGEEMSSRLMPPKVGRHPDHGLDDLVRVLGVQADREGVDVGELLEQHRLALHHRHRRLGADVAEAEHRGAVGDHGHGVRLDRVLERLLAVLGDRRAHARDAGRVGHREVVAGLERHVQPGVDLAAPVHLEGAVGDLHHARRAHRLHRRDHLAAVLDARALDRDLAQRVVALGLHRVDGDDGAAGARDRRRHLAEHARGFWGGRRGGSARTERRGVAIWISDDTARDPSCLTASLALLVAALLAAPASARRHHHLPPDARRAPGSATGSSRQLGNGGYDARHYDLSLTYPSSAPLQAVSGELKMLARAKQSLSRFDLDFAGQSVTGVRVGHRRAGWTLGDGELAITPRHPIRARPAGSPSPFDSSSGPSAPDARRRSRSAGSPPTTAR